ncbi:MAG: isochorismatase family protein [Planctomycetaceae bacterium]|nr:isochorismatase family protein [Planctomycetaceae bacterium]
MFRHVVQCSWVAPLMLWAGALSAAPPGEPGHRTYENRLVPIADAVPLLADYAEFVEPLREQGRFAAPALIDDPDGDLAVRAWRFSYNARGIIEIPNRVRARETAVIVVHPWGIDDANGWKSPQPAGVALCCTPEKNRIYQRHVREVLNPLLEKLRPRVGLVGYSLPNREDPIRKQVYRSVRGRPSAAERTAGAKELAQALAAFDYRGNPLDERLKLDQNLTAVSYFQQFPGIDSSAKFNHEGFWQLPIPLASAITAQPDDVVFYDAEGYPVMRDFLRSQGIKHVLLCGYNTDMCVCSTTAGYENLSRDFNLFLIGDATLATFPACETPRYATQTALAKASLTQLITQISWVEFVTPRPVNADRSK